MPLPLPTIRVTKQFSFEMAHALTGHDGPCRNIHGHSYLLSVTVSGIPSEDAASPKNGMVMDFTDLKKIVHEKIVSVYDHALVLNESDKGKLLVDETSQRIIYLPFPPTCEMLLFHFQRLIAPSFPGSVSLVALRLDETRTSFAEWLASDNL